WKIILKYFLIFPRLPVGTVLVDFLYLLKQFLQDFLDFLVSGKRLFLIFTVKNNN
ncbi:hypothetical protein RhiirA4_550402, partial [Rhizophagus irregularis]